jgi:hypothetical protein
LYKKVDVVATQMLGGFGVVGAGGGAGVGADATQLSHAKPPHAIEIMK